jgi:hypothetical protein
VLLRFKQQPIIVHYRCIRLATSKAKLPNCFEPADEDGCVVFATGCDLLATNAAGGPCRVRAHGSLQSKLTLPKPRYGGVFLLGGESSEAKISPERDEG